MRAFISQWLGGNSQVADLVRAMLNEMGVNTITIGVEARPPEDWSQTLKAAAAQLEVSDFLIVIAAPRYGTKPTEWAHEESAIADYISVPPYVFKDERVELGGALKSIAEVFPFNEYAILNTEEGRNWLRNTLFNIAQYENERPRPLIRRPQNRALAEGAIIGAAIVAIVWWFFGRGSGTPQTRGGRGPGPY